MAAKYRRRIDKAQRRGDGGRPAAATVYRPDIGGPRVTDCIYVGESANEILTDYPRKLIRAGKQ